MSKEMLKAIMERFVSNVEDVAENVAGSDGYAVFDYSSYKNRLQKVRDEED